jgi:hypothetical protein
MRGVLGDHCCDNDIFEDMIPKPTPKMDKKEYFPSTQPLEDYLDFSRMSVPPHRDVLLKRLLENLLRFSGNHLASWMVLLLIWGVVLNGRILAAMTILAAINFCGKALFVQASLAEASLRTFKKEDDVNERIPASAKHWFLVFALFVAWAVSILFQVIASFLVTLALSSLHAIMRPIVNEYYFIHQPKPKFVPNVVHSDGYVDNLGEDEVVSFQENDNPNTSTIRRRNLEGKSEGL